MNLSSDQIEKKILDLEEEIFSLMQEGKVEEANKLAEELQELENELPDQIEKEERNAFYDYAFTQSNEYFYH